MCFQGLRDKKGEAGIEEILKWILYLAIVIAAGFAIRNIAMKYA